jgi:hypothetical protein
MKFFSLKNSEDDVPLEKLKEKNAFFASLKSMKKVPDPLVRGTDPGIRIRTKMSRIPNTVFLFVLLSTAKDC